ncbi:MAG: right-handed parallel beta-helix repeat-containing protein [Victivallales bacterium]|nr:right-handed parallel beta-helix repeat-containing protein [Victivallales bacterium]
MSLRRHAGSGESKLHARLKGIVLLMAIAMNIQSVLGAIYHLDSVAGNDANSGRTQETAWRSLERLAGMSFSAGDKILLRGGQTFVGGIKLDAKAAGKDKEFVVIGSFGEGKAVIDAGDGTGISLEESSFVLIEKLKIVGCGRKEGNNGNGIRLVNTRHVTVNDVEATGFRLAGVFTTGDSNTRIVGVHAHDNGAAGIEVTGWSENRSKDIYIGYCRAENNPGDPENITNHSGNGIVVGGLQNCLIEYCVAWNNGWDMPRKGNGPVGIWGWDCDRLTIQHCISFNNKSPGQDGGGFDFDGGVTNSVMQHNLSYGNEGPGYLLCQYPDAPVWKNNIVRHNISYKDGTKNSKAGIALWEGGKDISDALVHDNIIVNEAHAVTSTHEIHGIVFRDNTFISGGSTLSGKTEAFRFEGNIYWPGGGKKPIYDKDGKVYMTLQEWSDATGQETEKGKVLGKLEDSGILLPSGAEELPANPAELAKMKFFRRAAPIRGIPK